MFRKHAGREDRENKEAFMLIAIVSTLFLILSGPSFGIPYEQVIKEMRDALKISIADHDRTKRLLAIVDEMEDGVKEHNKQVNESAKALSRLISKYEAKPEELQAALDQLDDSRMKAQRNLVKLRFGMKGSMSRDEWSAVFERGGKD